MNDEQLNQQWRDLSRAVRPEDEIRTWGYETGYGKPFKIWDWPTRDEIKIYSGTIKGKRGISRKEFMLIRPHWEDYRDSGVGRDVMQTRSQNTSYIFGMLKWLEDQ